MKFIFFLLQFALNTTTVQTTQNKETVNILKKKYQIRDSFTFTQAEIHRYKKENNAERKKLERKQDTKSCQQSAAQQHNTSQNKEKTDTFTFELEKKEIIRKHLIKDIECLYKDEFNKVYIEECIGMPLFYIEGYLGFSNLMQRRIYSANERNKQKNNNVDCEESKKSIYASDWVQQKEDTDFLVNYIYCFNHDIKKLPQLIFDYMLNKEIKRLETMSTAKNNINTYTDELVTEKMNEGDVIEQKNKSTKTKKFFNFFKNNKTANTEDRKYKTELTPKNNINNSDNFTNHLLFKRSYKGLMVQLIKMLKNDSSLHNILIQNNDAFIAKYTQDESFYLMLILRNCILAAKHEVLQEETITFYEQALQNYTIECQKNNLKYAKESYKTILTLQLKSISKKLKLLYIKWSKDNRKS